MRAFIAIIPPEQVVHELQRFATPRQDAVAGRREWRWTRPEHLHLTLAFLPELQDWREEALIESVQEWAARRRPAPLALRGAGAFPDPGAARVLWAGLVDRDEVLPDWAKGLRALASRAGADVQGTRFHPHVTLARAQGRPRAAGHLLQALDTLASSTWEVLDVVLVSSHLGQGPAGTPRYEERHTWSLGS